MNDDTTNNETVASTSDERVANNVMRHEYRVLSDQEKANMQRVKDAGLDFITLLDSPELSSATGCTREIALAKTKIEEAVMWAVKHITR